MATTSFFVIILPLILIASFLTQTHANHTHLLQIPSLLPPTSCNSTPGHGRSSMPTVFHRLDEPCSRLQTLARDRSRVSSIQSRLSKKNQNRFQDSQTTTLPVASGDSIGSGSYVVSVGIGTPVRHFWLALDTGSDLTWIQCEPCTGSCYPQVDPIYEPTRSASYSNVTCGSSLCVGTKGNTCAGQTCVYQVTYGDQSFTVGFLATERLALSRSGTDSFEGFVFGCGENNQGLFNGAAGLLGLGRSEISLVSQTVRSYNRVFSYCLPSKPGQAGFLKLGTSKPSPNTIYTPLVESADATSTSFYFLNLIGLVVGGERLRIPESAFSMTTTLIDSGTTITRLPPAAYAKLKASFKRKMGRYPETGGLSILDTCYNLSGYNTVNVPKIGLLFRGGTEFVVDSSGVLYIAENASQACLAFAGNDDATSVAIIGNVQQQKTEIVYDVAGGRVGFSARRCS